MPTDITSILIGALILCVIILATLVIRLEIKLKRFLVAKGAVSIDDSLTKLSSDTKELQTFRTELESYLKTVEKRLRRSVQSIHTIRFNPFKGTGSGGNQSFATAFMNEDGDGVVISSLYSREHVSVFSKPVKKSASEYELTVEEKTALTEAKKTL
ncbi:MAG: DUF4446 family protein [Candidatus Taylorbacteria bacterium]|nr:DUF4446 family protein [Candidatus Taylorbacteria bacterium]